MSGGEHIPGIEGPASPGSPARLMGGKVWPWVTLGLAFAALAVLALYRAWPLLYPTVVATAPLNLRCDLRSGPCASPLPGGGELSFSLEPRALPPMTPLRVVANVAGLDVRSAEVDFSGTDMNMGYNRVSLGQTEGGRFEGQAILPVCVRHRMEWEARVLLHTDAGILAAPFRFETVSAESAVR